MAEALRPDHGHTAGHNGPDRALFLGYVRRHHEIDDELQEAQESVRSIRRQRKDLRKTIGADGLNIDEFDRALADAKRSGEEREAGDKQYRQYMVWLDKPVGYQADLSVDTDAGAEAARQNRLDEIGRDGFGAGREGHDASLNSWSPGTEEFAAWLSAWTRGQGEKVEAEIRPADAPKRRGRPRKNAEAEAAPKPNGSEPAPPNEEAARLGYENGLAGNRDNAARWASGEYGHADYELNWAKGEAKRQAAADGQPANGETLYH